MQRLRSKLLFLGLALSLAAPGWTQIADPVRRVGSHLACQCGTCDHSVAACEMYGCFSQKARDRIAKMQAAGMSDRAIIDQFVTEYGQGIYRAEPNAFGWIVPYAALGLGLCIVFLLARRFYYRKPQPATIPSVDDAGLERYKEQIEKDVARLE